MVNREEGHCYLYRCLLDLRLNMQSTRILLSLCCVLLSLDSWRSMKVHVFHLNKKKTKKVACQFKKSGDGVLCTHLKNVPYY